jgi:hypothetical protein
VPETRPESDRPKELFRLPSSVLRGAPVDELRDHRVLERREFAKEVVELKDETDQPVANSGQLSRRSAVQGSSPDEDPTAARTVEGAKEVQERGLPCPAGSDDCDRLTEADLEPYPLENAEFTPVPETKALMQILGPKGNLVFGRTGRGTGLEGGLTHV